jgi:hypothetical protein
MTHSTVKPRSALTLLETIVVLAILCAGLGLVFAWIQGVRETSSRLTCQHHLKELVLAVHLHHDNKGVMPPYASGKHGEIFGGWFVHLMPYLGHGPLYDQLTSNQHHKTSSGFQLVTSGHSHVQGVTFQEMLCASDPSHATNDEPRTNYLANWYAFSDGVRGAYRPAQPFRNLTDGLSHVVLFAEGYRECNHVPRLAMFSWPYHNFGITQDGKPSDDPSYAPNDFTMLQIKPSACDKWRSQTGHAAMPVALADGACRFVAPSIAHDTWKQILKPRDGNPSSDW